MAKVWGPLHSDDARGKLADSLVFIGWRGVKDVRMYKIPANPQTVAQQAWRANFTTSVARYHDLSGADVVNWRERAAGFAYLGFNIFVKKRLDWLVSSLTPVLIRNLTGSTTTVTIQVTIAATRTGSMTVSAGVTKGVWTHTASIHASAGGTKATITGLTTDTNYYFTAEMNNASFPGEYGYAKYTTA